MPNSMLIQTALKKAYQTGHAWNPSHPELHGLTEDMVGQMNGSEEDAKKLLRSFSQSMAREYTKSVHKHHGRMRPDFDGELGKAMEDIVNTDRCPIPDYIPPPDVEFNFKDRYMQQVVEQMQQNYGQVNAGNWLECHDAPDGFHKAIADVDLGALPSHLKGGVFEEVLGWVQKSYAQYGHLWIFRDSRTGKDLLTGLVVEGNANTEMSFVNSSDGWIGLAILGYNQTCRSVIWARFLNRYVGGSTREQIIHQWVSLIAHELGHNCGINHTNGGVMNSHIINGLPLLIPKSDPMARELSNLFAGRPYPDINDPQPPQPPDDDLDWRREKDLLDVVQSVQLELAFEKINELGKRISVLERN